MIHDLNRRNVAPAIAHQCETRTSEIQLQRLKDSSEPGLTRPQTVIEGQQHWMWNPSLIELNQSAAVKHLQAAITPPAQPEPNNNTLIHFC